MVESDGFEPPRREEQIYSLSQSTALPTLRIIKELKTGRHTAHDYGHYVKYKGYRATFMPPLLISRLAANGFDAPGRSVI